MAKGKIVETTIIGVVMSVVGLFIFLTKAPALDYGIGVCLGIVAGVLTVRSGRTGWTRAQHQPPPVLTSKYGCVLNIFIGLMVAIGGPFIARTAPALFVNVMLGYATAFFPILCFGFVAISISHQP